MPELPEVETIRRDLETRLVGRRIQDVHLLWEPVVARPDPGSFRAVMRRRCVEAVRRRGKYLIFDMDTGSRLVIHLRMTGRLYWPRPDEPQSAHVRAVFHVADRRRASGHGRRGIKEASGVAPASYVPSPTSGVGGREAGGGRRESGAECELHFADQRKFGRFYWVADERELAAMLGAKLGPEPLESEFTVERLAAALATRRAPIKAALLDQRVIAGLGNIYVDEALFRARIHPLRPARALAVDEVERLYGAVQAALRQGIANRGTTLTAYRDAWGTRGLNQEQLLVFRRQGQACPRCGALLEKIRVAGRGTHLCLRCQPRPSDE
jgi:formamidopyrimidine-DNA glycosylase